MPDRPRDFRGGEHRRADLVEQRLEQVMVPLIDDGDAQPRPGRGTGEAVAYGQTAEPCADDDDVMRRCFGQGCPLTKIWGKYIRRRRPLRASAIPWSSPAEYRSARQESRRC